MIAKILKDNPDKAQELLSIDEPCKFTDILKLSLKYYAKGIDIKDDYIDQSIVRACGMIANPKIIEEMEDDKILDLILSIGFWAKWAPEEYEFQNYYDDIEKLVSHENPVIRAGSLASMGFIWQRQASFAQKWEIFIDAFECDDQMVKNYSLFGFSHAVRNHEVRPDAEVIAKLVGILDENDPEIREEASQILKLISKNHPSMLQEYQSQLTFVMKQDVDNHVVSNLRAVLSNINE